MFNWCTKSILELIRIEAGQWGFHITIHARFNNRKPNTKKLDLDESFTNIRLDEGIGPLIEQPSKIDMSNQVTKQP